MKKCRVCGVEIAPNRVYCSNKCKEKYRYDTNLIRKRCSVCNRKFIGKKGESVCSNECSKIAQRKYKKTCPICQKIFDARGNGIYCSDICYRTANDKKKGLTISSCEVCKKSFRKRITSDELTCSDTCSSELFSYLIKTINQNIFGTDDPQIISDIISHMRMKDDAGPLDNKLEDSIVRCDIGNNMRKVVSSH